MTGRSARFADRLSWLRAIFILDPLIFFYTGVLGALSLLCSFFDRDGGIQHTLARFWSWLILKTIMSPVRATGWEHVDTAKPAVYIVNHLSAVDIPVLYVHLPFQFRIMAKKELFKVPFMGWHLTRSGQISIDQGNAFASMRSVKQGVKALNHGHPLVVFPEGGRAEDGRVQPFISGAFYLAIKAQVEVVPLALVGTFEILKMNAFHVRPGPIELLVGNPISTSGYTTRDMDKLSAVAKKAVEELYYSRAIIQPSTPQEADVSKQPI